MSAQAPSFVRDAIREKAARELALVDRRTSAFDAVVHTRDVLTALVASSAIATPTIAACADSSTIGKLKRLRKAIDDAKLLADDIADAMGVDDRRGELDAARAEIEKALATVGVTVDELREAAE